MVDEMGRAEEESARKARQLIEAVKTYSDDQRW
jgi:hypothetical protein